MIAEEFKKLILDKTAEKESESIVKGRNIILLNKKFECIICFRTTALSEGFWGIQNSLISTLKRIQQDNKCPYVFVFLLASDAGYLLRDSITDDFLKQCSQGKSGDYKIHEEELRGNNSIFKFRTMDELIDCLSLYKK